MKLAFMSIGLEMFDNMPQFFRETFILAKQVKHISKRPATKALCLGNVIHTDLVGPITPTGSELPLDSSAKNIRFSNEMSMRTLNEALENDGDESTDHSHTPLNSPLSSLVSTQDPIPDTTLPNIISHELWY